jgi:cadmium resistance protein CadD (predicted permease)
MFFLLVGVWCYVSERLTRLPAVAQVLTQAGNRCAPYVLIGLGGLILWQHTLQDRGLTVIAALIGLAYLLIWQPGSETGEQ